MGTYFHGPASAALAAILCSFACARAETLELRGLGTLPDLGTAPAGVAGEGIIVSVMLNSDDFIHVSPGNPEIHYFAPNTTIPVNIFGAVSGDYRDVSPIGRFVALELAGSPSQGDMIKLDVAAGTSGTSLFSLSTHGQSGFDGSITPQNSTELFALFADAMNNDGLWQKSTSSAVFVGATNDLLFLGDLEWSLVNPVAGDFDGDGDVDGRDFLVWQRDSAAGNLADWQSSYGTSSLAFAGHTSVPEPVGIVHLLAAITAAARSRKVRHVR